MAEQSTNRFSPAPTNRETGETPPPEQTSRWGKTLKAIKIAWRIAKYLMLVAALYGGYQIYRFVKGEVSDAITTSNNIDAVNTGKSYYNPLDRVLASPAQKGEGFVCPGPEVVLYGGPGIGDLEIKGPTKVKLTKGYGADGAKGEVVGVKVIDGQGDPDGPHTPEFRMYKKFIQNSLPCK